jgi:hypothetical protein
VRWALALVTLLGCGRLDFDARSDGSPPRFASPHVLLYGGDLGAAATSWYAKLATFAPTAGTVDDAIALDATLLDGNDLVVVRDLASAHSAAEATALASFVAAGGSVMVMAGYVPGTGDMPHYNALLAALPIQLAAPLLNGDVTTFVTHPLTANLAKLPYMGGYAVVNNAASTNVALVIATFGTATVAAAAPIGTGRIYAFGDEWVTFDQDWTTYSSSVFWDNAFAWLRHET